MTAEAPLPRLPETFPLAHPVEHGGKTYTKITVRRAKVRDIIAAERQPGETAREAQLLAILADVPFGMVGDMDAGDYHSICARAGIGFLLGAFLAAPSGDSSSPSTPAPAGDSPTS